MRPRVSLANKVVRGIEPKSSVRIVFTGPFDWTQKNRYDLSAMVELANIKLRNVLREEKSGTYGVSVSASPSLYPRKEYTLTISFGCDPARVPEMVHAAFQQIDSLKQVDADGMKIFRKFRRFRGGGMKPILKKIVSGSDNCTHMTGMAKIWNTYLIIRNWSTD